jgi:hypothetical protein
VAHLPDTLNPFRVFLSLPRIDTEPKRASESRCLRRKSKISRAIARKNKSTLVNAPKNRVSSRSRFPPSDLAADCAPTTYKMSSFNIFAFQSCDLPESGEESQKNSAKQQDQFATENVQIFQKRDDSIWQLDVDPIGLRSRCLSRKSKIFLAVAKKNKGYLKSVLLLPLFPWKSGHVKAKNFRDANDQDLIDLRVFPFESKSIIHRIFFPDPAPSYHQSNFRPQIPFSVALWS